VLQIKLFNITRGYSSLVVTHTLSHTQGMSVPRYVIRHSDATRWFEYYCPDSNDTKSWSIYRLHSRK